VLITFRNCYVPVLPYIIGIEHKDVLMRALIDYKRARVRHPELAAKALEELTRKSERLSRGPLILNDVVWAYDWAVGFKGPNLSGDTLDRCFVTLGAKATRLSVSSPIGEGDGKPTPRDLLPIEVVETLLRLERVATEKDTPHITSFDTIDAGKNTKALVTAGARDNKGLDVVFVKIAGRPELSLPQIYESKDGGGLNFKGYPVKTFRERLLETGEGASFSYMRKQYTRLTESEIYDLVHGGTPTPDM